MDNRTKRIILYLFGCVLFRFILVLIAKNIAIEKLPYMGYLASIPAIGFAVIYLGGLRKTGGEVFGDRIWWNSLRPIHSALYFLLVYMAVTMQRNAYRVLLLDVILGLVSFLGYHFIL